MAEKNESKYKRGRYRKQAEKSVEYPQPAYAGKSREYAIEDTQKRMAFDRGKEPSGKRIAGSQYNEKGKYVKRTGKKTTRKRVAGK